MTPVSASTAPVARSSGKVTFGNIQGLRGIAALMVMLIHLFSARADMGAEWFKYKYWWFGPAGVDIFFAISGFIVTIAAIRAAAADDALAFGVRRFLRIYPLYWCVLVIAVPASAVLDLAPKWLPHASGLQLLFLMTTNNDKVLAAWTLCYEMFFYVMLTNLIVLAPRNFFKALAIWIEIEIVLVVLAQVWFPALKAWPFADPLVLEFAAGCVVAFLVHRGERRHGVAVLVLGLIGFAIGCVVNAYYGNWDHLWRFAVLGLPSALIVYGLVAIEGTAGKRMPAWLLRVGDASYSLYIWHQLVFAALAWATARIGGYDLLPHRLILAIWFAIAVAWGFVSYRLIEAPTVRFAHRLFSAGKAATPESAA